MTPFWIALQFLTTFPVQLTAMPSARQNAQSLLFYPLVGLFLGTLLTAMALLLHALPLILLSSLIVVIWIWLSGGLHLDGLADTADAWVGGFGDAERTLAIMKDPSCGPIGVLSLLIVVLLKWSTVYVLLQQQQAWMLLLIPVLGRIAPLFLFLTTPYVRAQGLGSAMQQHLPKTLAKILILLSLLSCLMYSWMGMITVMTVIGCYVYLRHKFMQRIQGITGDTVGASIEIGETVAMLTLSITLSAV